MIKRSTGLKIKSLRDRIVGFVKEWGFVSLLLICSVGCLVQLFVTHDGFWGLWSVVFCMQATDMLTNMRVNLLRELIEIHRKISNMETDIVIRTLDHITDTLAKPVVKTKKAKKS